MNTRIVGSLQGDNTKKQWREVVFLIWNPVGKDLWDKDMQISDYKRDSAATNIYWALTVCQVLWLAITCCIHVVIV